MDRIRQLEAWVADRLGTQVTLTPASADASFRSYWRLHAGEGTLIAMDAPPAHEDCRPFIAVAELFSAAGVHVPEIVAADLDQGFLLLSDLGTQTYLSALNAGNRRQLYSAATDALVRIQLASRPGVLPAYDEQLLLRELELFPQWYLHRHRGLLLDAAEDLELRSLFALLVRVSLRQPAVYVHRDYHCRNLMVSKPNPGVLDFQDAVYGPITYDLVSLLRDAYVSFDEEVVLDGCIRYWEKARRAGLPVDADFAAFYRDFEWVGVQRHLKVLGIFARLHHRDGKNAYLQDLPRVYGYVRAAAERYGELVSLLRLLERLEDGAPVRTGG